MLPASTRPHKTKYPGSFQVLQTSLLLKLRACHRVRALLRATIETTLISIITMKPGACWAATNLTTHKMAPSAMLCLPLHLLNNLFLTHHCRRRKECLMRQNWRSNTIYARLKCYPVSYARTPGSSTFASLMRRLTSVKSLTSGPSSKQTLISAWVPYAPKRKSSGTKSFTWRYRCASKRPHRKRSSTTTRLSCSWLKWRQARFRQYQHASFCCGTVRDQASFTSTQCLLTTATSAVSPSASLVSSKVSLQTILFNLSYWNDTTWHDMT